MTDSAADAVSESFPAQRGSPQAATAAADNLRLPQIMAFASLNVGLFFFYVPMWSILQGVYAKYYGLKLTAIAVVVVFIRLFDGITDPLIGYLADRHRAAGGSRSSWVFVGSLGMIIPCYFLFTPPGEVTLTYYMGWSLVYFLFMTVASIPYATWASELTGDYQRRSYVFGAKHIAIQAGTLALYAMPFLVSGSGGFTPEVMAYAVYLGAAIVVGSVVWAWFKAPPSRPMPPPASSDSVLLLMRSLTQNKPLLLYFGAYASVGLSVGMWFGLMFVYVDTYLGMPQQLATILIMSTVLTAVFTPVCLKLIRWTDKTYVWSLGIYLFCLQLIGTLFITPSSPWWYIGAAVVTGHISFCCNNVSAISILGDIADYGRLKFRRDRTATYFAFNALLFKIGVGAGGGLALGMAGLFGFDPTADANSDSAIFGLKLSFIGAPLLISLLGLFCVWRTPIDRRRQGIVKRRLESLAERAA